MIACDGVKRRGRPVGALTITRGERPAPGDVCRRANAVEALTQAEVGVMGGISTCRVQQIEAAAIDKLRHGLTCVARDCQRDGIDVTVAELVALVPTVLAEMGHG